MTGFFYNPNIHPFAEYRRREEAVRAYAGGIGCPVDFGGYELTRYFQAVVYDEGIRERCPACWWLRLEKTVRRCAALGAEAFTTTLLGSPYQDHGILRRIGEEVSKNAGIPFCYRDFRGGFRSAHAKAKAEGVYCQQYCGCLFSEVERYRKAKG